MEFPAMWLGLSSATASRRRIAYLAHVREIRDALAPFGKFKDWCAADEEEGGESQPTAPATAG
jgi:hypothetical protein